MLPLLSINHISRVCRDVDATRRFYRDVLGFVEIKRPDSFDFDGSWCVPPKQPWIKLAHAWGFLFVLADGLAVGFAVFVLIFCW